jgi:hypothetical protein
LDELTAFDVCAGAADEALGEAEAVEAADEALGEAEAAGAAVGTLGEADTEEMDIDIGTSIYAAEPPICPESSQALARNRLNERIGAWRGAPTGERHHASVEKGETRRSAVAAYAGPHSLTNSTPLIAMLLPSWDES